MRHCQQHRFQQNSQRGSTLLELMIAMLVLAIGLGAITTMLVVAMASNNKNSHDTSATLLAQMVIEQVSAQNVYSDVPIGTTDCAGNAWAFSTTPGAVGTGSGATLTANGTIDFTQPYANVPAGYAMLYVDCSNGGGPQTVYDVRWNVMSVSTNTTTRMITAAARPTASNVKGFGSFYYALPINLRGIGGPTVGE